MRANRRDANESVIRQAVEAYGWLWLPCDRHFGCDAVIVKGERVEFIEVKDPAKAPSARALTPAEARFHQRLRAHGKTVQLLTDAESLEVLERTRPREYYP